MNGWWWIIASLLLAGLELATPGYAFLGAAAGVGVMGAAILLGLWHGSLPAALVVAALLSGAVWLGLRAWLPRSRGSVRVWTRDIND